MKTGNKNYLQKKTASCLPESADLHLHTTASDGTLAPRQMVIAAKEAGLTTIAITDHDSVGGIRESLAAGEEFCLQIIPGIELSTVDGEKELHILGYFIDPSNNHLNSVIRGVIDDRENRAVRMVQKLNELGINISIERVREISGTAFIGRPHIARAMLEMGYIRDPKEAFSTEYIGNGGRAFVERFKISPEDAIGLIRDTGGVAVLAHPGYLGDRTALLEEDIVRYADAGLDGIEVYYSHHTPAQVEYYKGVAEKYQMLITGGSDSHGTEDLLLGTVRLPHEYVSAMITYRNRKSSSD